MIFADPSTNLHTYLSLLLYNLFPLIGIFFLRTALLHYFLPLLLKYSFKWTKLCILVLLILSMSYLISTPILLFRPKFRPHSSYFISNSYIIPASVFIPNVNLIPHISFLISTSFLLFNPNRRLVLRTVWHP